ncbi:hypothetical protein LTR36_001381 [Oleoguttula mirabilis]|uniref:Uncharacterized protein n=1 Tax=Oleoguttula mirabilis TaxID=1507867 RepID=A0AAV9JP34_9PEZI|nr:hypothetical protein LTR36_001381 [Oleoguttula mirabilis]
MTPTMPTLLSTTAPADVQKRALAPLTTAIANMHGTSVLDFAKTVFGDETAEKAVQERKEEMKGMQINGNFGESGCCTAIMRCYVVLKSELGETANAEELKGIPVAYWERGFVEGELAKVEAGW